MIVVSTHSLFYSLTFNLLFSLYSWVLALLLHWFVFGSLFLSSLSLATYKGQLLVFDSLDYPVTFNIVIILEICYFLGFYPSFYYISLVTFFLTFVDFSEPAHLLNVGISQGSILNYLFILPLSFGNSVIPVTLNTISMFKAITYISPSPFSSLLSVSPISHWTSMLRCTIDNLISTWSDPCSPL